MMMRKVKARAISIKKNYWKWRYSRKPSVRKRRGIPSRKKSWLKFWINLEIIKMPVGIKLVRI